MKKQFIIFTSINLGISLLFSGCATLNEVFLEEMESEPKMAYITEEDDSVSLRSVAIVCVDAFVQVGSVSVYKGTTCWFTGSGTGVGIRPPGAPSTGESGPTYTPNGYPSSQGGTGFNPPQQNLWKFPFRRLQDSPLYGFTSTLNLMDKEALMQVFEILNSSSTPEDFKAIYKYLTDRGIRIDFKMDPTMIDPGKYDIRYKDITFRINSVINLDNLIEELIHAVQDQGFYGSTMPNMKVNCEFEAKVIRDLASCFRSEDYGDCPCTNIGSMGESTSFMREYTDFINNIISKRRFTDINKFNDLCSRWNGYSGSYVNNFNPQVLQHFFGRLRPPKK